MSIEMKRPRKLKSLVKIFCYQINKKDRDVSDGVWCWIEML